MIRDANNSIFVGGEKVTYRWSRAQEPVGPDLAGRNLLPKCVPCYINRFVDEAKLLQMVFYKTVNPGFHGPGRKVIGSETLLKELV